MNEKVIKTHLTIIRISQYSLQTEITITDNLNNQKIAETNHFLQITGFLPPPKKKYSHKNNSSL